MANISLLDNLTNHIINVTGWLMKLEKNVFFEAIDFLELSRDSNDCAIIFKKLLRRLVGEYRPEDFTEEENLDNFKHLRAHRDERLATYITQIGRPLHFPIDEDLLRKLNANIFEYHFGSDNKSPAESASTKSQDEQLHGYSDSATCTQLTSVGSMSISTTTTTLSYSVALFSVDSLKQKRNMYNESTTAISAFNLPQIPNISLLSTQEASSPSLAYQSDVMAFRPQKLEDFTVVSEYKMLGSVHQEYHADQHIQQTVSEKAVQLFDFSHQSHFQAQESYQNPQDNDSELFVPLHHGTKMQQTDEIFVPKSQALKQQISLSWAKNGPRSRSKMNFVKLMKSKVNGTYIKIRKILAIFFKLQLLFRKFNIEQVCHRNWKATRKKVC